MTQITRLQLLGRLLRCACFGHADTCLLWTGLETPYSRRYWRCARCGRAMIEGIHEGYQPPIRQCLLWIIGLAERPWFMPRVMGTTWRRRHCGN